MKCVKLLKLELRVIMEEQLSTDDVCQSLVEAMEEFCEFDYADIQVKEEHEAIWVEDDFSLGPSN